MSTDTSQITVGLDIGYDAVRLVAIEQTPQGPVLRRIGEQPLSKTYPPPVLFNHGDDIASAIRTVVADHCEPEWPVIVGLRNRFATVMIPKVDESMPPQSTYDWLMWEAEQFTDESISNYIVDIGWTGNTTDTGREVFVVAARHDSVDALERITRTAEMTPAGLTVATIALINAFEVTHSLSEWESAAIAHIEPGAIDIIFMRDTSHNLTVMPLESIQGSDDQAIAAFSTQFRHLLNVMPEEDAPDTVYVSSVRHNIKKLCEQWGEELNRRITIVAPFHGLNIDESIKERVKKMNEAAFMVATGLAMQPEA